MCKYAKILMEFFCELIEVPDIIDPFVEAAGKLRGDRLQGDPFVGQGDQDHQELLGGLWKVGLIHRDLGDEVP